jgi:hypothetical protein
MNPCEYAIQKELWENVMQTKQWKKLEADKKRMRLKRQAEKKQKMIVREAGDSLLPTNFMKGV